MENNQNPLAGYFRKPEVYISLPSKGQYYPAGSIDMPPTGEIGIFPMTAKDELIFKTPDALLNGSSTAEVIRSCVPAIKDPWSVPSLDMDALLIGIRIATYGNEMDITSTCPSCSNRNEYEIDLGSLLDQTSRWVFDTVLEIDDLVIHFKPITYKEMNVESLRQFEESKIMRIVNDNNISDEDKQKLFQEAFIKLTAHTVDLIGKTISQIDSPNGSTDDPQFISEFIQNTSRKVFGAIQDHLDTQKQNNSFSDFEITCQNCENKYKTPIVFDNSNFFA
jgi:hypothetical protein